MFESKYEKSAISPEAVFYILLLLAFIMLSVFVEYLLGLAGQKVVFRGGRLELRDTNTENQPWRMRRTGARDLRTGINMGNRPSVTRGNNPQLLEHEAFEQAFEQWSSRRRAEFEWGAAQPV
jgi:hypothetical protein